MNYRHIFHAGNICDVVKHAVLTLLIDHLRSKEKGFCVLDTHAGTGLYDLNDARAGKTGEAQNGIYKLLAAPEIPELASYYAVLKKLNSGAFQHYPGSPLLAQNMLRPQDRLIACELHEEDVKELRHFVPGAHAHHRDGYEALKAFLPPEEKRGLVLIDPPYEKTDEFETLIAAVKGAHQRWAQGITMIWYPIKERPAVWQFHEALVATGIPKVLCAEFIYQEETRHDRLNGSGLILVNPPWKLDEQLKMLFPKLHEVMNTRYNQDVIKWLTPE